MNRSPFLTALLTLTSLSSVAYADTDAYGNTRTHTVTNSPGSAHYTAFNVGGGHGVSNNLANVSDTNGSNNHFLNGFGGYVNRDGTFIPNSTGYFIVNNQIYFTASGSRNNEILNDIGGQTGNSTLRYNLTNADGMHSSIWTYIAGIAGSSITGYATGNNVTLNLRNNVRYNDIWTTILGNAINNTVTNTLDNSSGNRVETMLGWGQSSFDSVSRNQVTNTLNATDSNRIVTGFNYSASLNTSDVVVTGGGGNQFFTGAGFFLNPNGTLVEGGPVFNVTGNHVVTNAAGSTNTKLETYLSTNATNNTVNHNLTNANGERSRFVTFIEGSRTGAATANSNTVTLNLAPPPPPTSAPTPTSANVPNDVRDNNVFTGIHGYTDNNSVTNTLFNSRNNRITTQIGNPTTQPQGFIPSASSNQFSHTLSYTNSDNIVTAVNYAAAYNVAQVSDTGGNNNKFHTAFGGYVDNTTGLVTLSNITDFIYDNKVYITATSGSVNNYLQTYLDNGAKSNTVSNNLSAANGEFSRFITYVTGSNAILNTVNLNLNGDVRWNNSFTQIHGRANNNIVRNSLTNSRDNTVDTQIGVMQTTQSTAPTSGNQAINTLVNADSNRVITGFNNFSMLNISQVTLNSGSFSGGNNISGNNSNRFYTGFGAFIEPNGSWINMLQGAYNIVGNRVYTNSQGNTQHNTVETYLGTNATNNWVYNNLNSANGYDSVSGTRNNFTTFIQGPTNSLETANLNRVYLNLYGNVQNNDVFVNIQGNSDSNVIQNTLNNARGNIIDVEVSKQDHTTVSQLATDSNVSLNYIQKSGTLVADNNTVTTKFRTGSRNNRVTNRIYGSNNTAYTTFGLENSPLLVENNVVTTTMNGDANGSTILMNSGNGNNVTVTANSLTRTASQVGVITGVTVNGSGNTVAVNGNGGNQFSSVRVNGSNNRGIDGYMVYQAGGGNNTAELNVNGSNTQSRVTQVGTNLNATLNMNCSGCSYHLQQNGSGLTATVTRTQ
jgi:hypothetical protein